MDADNVTREADRYASWLVKRKAKQLIATGLFPESEAADIEQELLMAVHRGCARYDPTRSGLKTFINRVVCNTVAGLIEARKAAKRGSGFGTRSLDEEIEDENGNITSFHESVSANDCFRRVEWSGGLSELQLDVKIDLTRAIRALPPELREVYERLKVQTVSEISQAMRISRGSVYRRIEWIRMIFARKGLDEYL